MNREELNEILEKHQKWLNCMDGGIRADLRNADLYNANLYGANLCGADLYNANLYGADLRNADLRGTDLCFVDLRNAVLRNANLCSASLSGANLRGADLCNVFFNEMTSFFELQCPEKGEYIAFKKASGFIVELKIPADALRSSATTRKCRANKAEVISITQLDGTPTTIKSIVSDYDSNFVYEVGKMVYVENFDTNRWNECAPGIHHFLTRQEAVNY